jgi:hypothetical protein
MLQRYISIKETFTISDFEAYFIRDLNSDDKSAIGIEANALDVASNTIILSETEIKLKITEAKAQLEKLKLEKKTAKDSKPLARANNQSKTDENYMDYFQTTQLDANGKPIDNPDFERKSYYQWQWLEIQKTGKQNNYFEEIK